MKKKTTILTLLTFILVSTLFLTLKIQTAHTEPTIITVPDDHPTIQEAINAANPGDIIYVKSGIYRENVIVNKTVTLIGEDNSDTIIDGGGSGTVILVTANNVSISNFTIRNSGNTFLDCGVLINQAGYNNVSNIILTNNYFGIRLNNSFNVILSDNKAISNKYGIELYHSFNSTLRGNNITNNQFNFGVWGLTFSHYIHDIDTSNLVDDKPLYYWVNVHAAEVPPGAGYIALINCTDITVKNQVLTNNGAGIQLAYTKNSSIINNNLTNNLHGIWLFHSSNNVLLDNNVTNNQCGISLFYSFTNILTHNNVVANRYGIALEDSSNNIIYHNKFLNERGNIALRSTNVLDNGYPSGGNYWGDYTGVDLKSGPNQDQPGSDGIGDTPYIIDENNKDQYPLMEYMAVHDVAITNIIPSKTVVGQGFTLQITIQATNKGNRLETANITLYINNTAFIKTLNLTLGTTNITFKINTASLTKGKYTLNATIQPVPEENNTADNTLTYNSTIIITVPGDTDGDRDIDIYDIVRIASAYGSKRGEARFKPNCDINSDDKIDIYDVVIATSRYGYKEK